MKWNWLNHLLVWVISALLMSLMCLFWPVIRFYPYGGGLESNFEYNAGFFCGVFVFQLQFSVVLIVLSYLLYFLLTARLHLSERVVKYALYFSSPS